jgi:hypothetical protein
VKTVHIPFGSTPPEKVPEQYLLVTENGSGDRWVMPLSSRAALDVQRQSIRFVKKNWSGDLMIERPFATGPDKSHAHYYAVIITDGHPIDSVVVWESVGFYVTTTY